MMIKDIPQAATHSSLDIFENPSILVNFDASNVQEIYPTTSVSGPNLDFSVRTDRNVFLDMQHIELKLAVKILAAGDKTLDTEGKDSVLFVNNILHSLFSNCEVYLNGELVSSSNGLYPHKAYLETEVSHGLECKRGILFCQGYTYEHNPGDVTSSTMENRMELTKKSGEVFLIGKLSVDLFNCERLMLPKVDMRIKLTKASPHFSLIAADESKGYHFKITRASLLTRQMILSEDAYTSIEKTHLKGPAKYVFNETIAKTFIIQDSQNEFIRDDLFQNQPIRRIALAMNTNMKFTGSLETNPYEYQKFDLRHVSIFRNGLPIVQLDTTNDVEAYYTTLKSLHFTRSGPAIPLSEFANHYILVFDVTSTLESDAELYFPELTGSRLRIELKFSKPLAEPVELFLLGEKLSTLYIDNQGKVTKNG